MGTGEGIVSVVERSVLRRLSCPGLGFQRRALGGDFVLYVIGEGMGSALLACVGVLRKGRRNPPRASGLLPSTEGPPGTALGVVVSLVLTADFSSRFVCGVELESVVPTSFGVGVWPIGVGWGTDVAILTPEPSREPCLLELAVTRDRREERWDERLMVIEFSPLPPLESDFLDPFLEAKPRGVLLAGLDSLEAREIALLRLLSLPPTLSRDAARRMGVLRREEPVPLRMDGVRLLLRRLRDLTDAVGPCADRSVERLRELLEVREVREFDRIRGGPVLFVSKTAFISFPSIAAWLVSGACGAGCSGVWPTVGGLGLEGLDTAESGMAAASSEVSASS